MKVHFFWVIALTIICGVTNMGLYEQKEILSQKETLIDSLQKENKRLDDSLFFIGYNFKENHSMDSLHFMGYIKCLRDEKEKAGFYGW